PGCRRIGDADAVGAVGRGGEDVPEVVVVGVAGGNLGTAAAGTDGGSGDRRRQGDRLSGAAPVIGRGVGDLGDRHLKVSFLVGSGGDADEDGRSVAVGGVEE